MGIKDKHFWKKKKKKHDLDVEELDFRLLVEEIEVIGSGHDVIEQMENKLRKIKREEEN